MNAEVYRGEDALEEKVHYGTKESFVKTKKILRTKRNINEGFVGVRKPKKVSKFLTNSKPFFRFRRKSAKPFKKTSRQLTIDLNVS